MDVEIMGDLKRDDLEFNTAAAERAALLRDEPPPPIQRGRGKSMLLFGAGLIVAVMLLIVVLNIDTRDSSDNPPPPEYITELIGPEPITSADETGGITNLAENPEHIGITEGWLQATDNGRLAQLYRFDHLDPAPPNAGPGWVKMTNPQVKVFMANERMLTLRSDSALVLMPNKAIESGTMTGGVLIRMYDSTDDAAAPVLEVRTEQASYDNFQGEVRCDGDVDIQTETAHVPGRGLRLQINDVESKPNLLIIDDIAGMIRIAGIDQQTEEPAPQPKPERSAGRGNGERKAKRQPEAALKQVPPAPEFYRLTIKGNVRLQQGDGSKGWVATGDDLHIIFSLDSKNLDDSLARSAPAARTRLAASHPLTLQQSLALLALASIQDSDPSSISSVPAGLYQSAPDEIRITCEGGLTMVPLLNDAEKPKSPDDSRFELIGQPVRLMHAGDGVDIRCATLLYESLDQKLTLASSTAHRLTIDSPEFHASSDRFWVSSPQSTGAFEGPGWMTAGERAPSDSPAGTTTQPADSTVDLRIAWQNRVDLSFQKGDETAQPADDADSSFGKLKLAKFDGGVTVNSEDFALAAQAMDVSFPDAAAADEHGALLPANHEQPRPRTTIEFISARGDVHIDSTSDEGAIDCDDLKVTFARSDDGRTIPVQMTARGNIEAADVERQTVWSDLLVVDFAPVERAGSSFGRTADVKLLTATQNVQVLMADGARAFADKLEADPTADVITLTAADLMVLSGETLAHHGTKLELRKGAQIAHWSGSGEFAHLTHPIAAEARGRIARPMIDETANPPQLKATWHESMTFDSAFNDGAGAVTLVGSVNAVSTPTAFELNTMNGQKFTLQFARPAPTDASTTQPATQPESALAGINHSDSRQFKQLIAEGDARLENRAWEKADHSDKPRVFFITGQRIAYDDQTLEAHVDSPGELLVRDERPLDPADSAATQPTAKSSSTPFSARGTTHFRWTESLHMTRQPGSHNRFDIVMLGSIEVRHLALDKSISTLTGQRLEATVERIAPAADGQPQPDTRAAAFDLGGSMDLIRLRGMGGVYIDSPTRDIDCDEFFYDYATGKARLDSVGDRVVTVTTAGNVHPTRARSIEWNLVEDTITVIDVSGAAGRP